jgi:glycosyltransferase involved in cell wall biosynthesis
VIAASRQSNKIYKLVDMLRAGIVYKNVYHIALIDVYSGLAFIWAEVVSALLRHIHKRYILTLHGGNLPLFSQRHPKRVERLLRHADVVTTPSEYLQSKLIGFRNDIRLIPNPLDIRKYEFKQRRNLSPVLVWLRAFHRIYNPTLALHVVHILREEFPEARLVMIGPDKHDGSLSDVRSQIEKLKLNQQVNITGAVSKEAVPDVLKQGDIFINTTNVDNTPVSVLEAMASGLCIVSTNVGGIPYLLEHQQDCLLVPPNDSRAMVGAITTLLKSPDLAQKISINARKKAEQSDILQTIQLWEKLFQELQHG